MKECLSSPCYNRGTCSESSTPGFVCSCPSGVHGNQCQYVTMATFDGQSLVQLTPLTANQNRRKRSIGMSRSVERSRLFPRSRPSEGSRSPVDKILTRLKRETVTNIKLEFMFKTSVGDGSILLATGVSVLFIKAI